MLGSGHNHDHEASLACVLAALNYLCAPPLLKLLPVSREGIHLICRVIPIIFEAVVLREEVRVLQLRVHILQS
jgi:hypothetical protein